MERGARSGHVSGEIAMPTLQQTRAARGLSRRELATRAGVSESTVARVERGTTTPRPGAARRLAAALGVPTSSIAELGRALAGTRLRAPTVRAL